MAVERTPSKGVPSELIRQGNRIMEQYNKLNEMIQTIHTDLQGTEKIMAEYNSELATQIKSLDDSVIEYNAEAKKIYTGLADNLNNYGSNLIYNLDNFSGNITKLINLLKTLKGN